MKKFRGTISWTYLLDESGGAQSFSDTYIFEPTLDEWDCEEAEMAIKNDFVGVVDCADGTQICLAIQTR